MSFMLDDLLHAVAGAVMSTRRLIEAHHQDLSHLFHPSKARADVLEPRTMSLMLPKNVVQDDKALEGVHEVPLATLVPHNSLALESMKLSMPCLIEGLSEDQGGAKRVSLIIGSSLPSRHSALATLSIEFQHGEPTEGMARINDQLLKKF